MLTRPALKLAGAVTVAGLLGACTPNAVRIDAARGAEAAAKAALELEPGPPPPAILPDVPLRSAKRRAPEIDRIEPELKLATTVGTVDVWARMRRQFTLPRTYGSRMEREIAWYQRNQPYIDRMAERAYYFLPYIVREAERRNLPVELALIPAVESAFQPLAYSPARAAGLWQFIPSTARLYGLRINWWHDARRDVVESTRAAFDYLEKLNREFDGDWLLALAAYNWGEGNVARAIRRNRAAGKSTDFWSLKMPAETRSYIPKWLAICEIVARPADYDMHLTPIADRIHFRRVTLAGQIDLSVAAELAGLTPDELLHLNGANRRWATDPDGPHQLLLPADRARDFALRVSRLPPEEQVTRRQYLVEPGDTLGEIAERFGTSVPALEKFNRLTSNLIRVGQTLVVPAGPDPTDSSLPTSNEAGANESRPSPSHRHHVVQSGESLGLIAERAGMTARALAALNGIDLNGVLRPGQRLSLLSAGDALPIASASRANSPTYVVRKGDSLWTIARRHRMSTRDLARLNHIDIHATLQPGQNLQVASVARARDASAVIETTPADRQIVYVVRPGDSLWGISRRFKVTVAALREWNELSPEGHLQPGQVLNVFAAGGKT